jgi:hypothetical protein
VACLALQYIPHISAVWPVWLYRIFQILAHCNLSGCTIYFTYQITLACLALQYIPHISALWPSFPYIIFHIVIQSARFTEKLIKPNPRIVILCINVSANFLILRNIQRDLIKSVYRYSSNVLNILSHLMHLKLSQMFFIKSLNTHFHENPSSRTRGGPKIVTDSMKTVRGSFGDFENKLIRN